MAPGMGCAICKKPSTVGPGETKEQVRAAIANTRRIDRQLKLDYTNDKRIRKLLLLGTGESGKSTIVKQMRIIHIDGFNDTERREKIPFIKRNLQESIVTIVGAMNTLGIDFRNSASRESADFVMTQATDLHNYDFPEKFFDHVQKLWEDDGIRECYRRSNEYQLIDCAEYFLDQIHAIRRENYLPSDQDILRCRVTTTNISQVDFKMKDKRKLVHFSAFDVGGQRGERKKWIQLFECCTAILFIVDCSSYDQTLRENEKKNRLLESLEIFDQTWNNRFLKTVSVILFVNKIDKLKEKVDSGRTVQKLVEEFPEDHKLYPIIKRLDYDQFQPKDAEKKKFVSSYPGRQLAKKLSKSHSLTDDYRRPGLEISPEVVKNAVYIMRMFTEITKQRSKDDEEAHSCHYFYTCAVNTDNIQKVLDGCKSLVVEEHLRRFGIL